MAHFFPVHRRILVFIAVFLAATYLSIPDDFPPITADQTTYIVLGKSLAEGRGYREIWTHAGNPHITYPPAYPALLAACIRLRGIDPYLMRLANFIFLSLALFLLCLLLRKRMQPTVCALIVLMTGIHPTIVWSGYHIFSEAQFFFLVMAALYCAERFRDDPRVVSGWGVCLAFSLAAAVMTRLAGMMLMVSTAAYLSRGRGPEQEGNSGSRLGKILAALSPAAILLAFWIARNLALAGSGSHYFSVLDQHPWDYDLRVGMLEKTARSAYAYIFYSLPHAATGMVFEHRSWIALVITAAAGIGFARAKKGAAEYFTAAYVVCMLFWSGVSGSRRYMVPLAPFIIAYFIQGAAALIRPHEQAGRRVAGLLLAVLFVARIGWFWADPALYREMTPEQAAGFLRAAGWIRAHTGPSDTIYGLHPQDIYLYTARFARQFPLKTLSASRMREFLQQDAGAAGAYLLVSSVYNRYGMLESYGYRLLGDAQRGMRGREVYRDGQAAVFKLALE